MSDLAGFLLARFDDDEADIAAIEVGQASARKEARRGGNVFAAGNRYLSPGSLRAEVEAKRRIIDLAFAHAATIDGEWGCCHSAEAIRSGWVEPDFDGDTRDPLPSGCYGPPAAAEFLQPLAQPFAGHPDFDPKWRLS